MNTRSHSILMPLLTIALALPAWAAPPAKQTHADTRVTEGGEQYNTQITRTSKGTLSNADLRQASLLTSQVLRHVNSAVQDLADRNIAEAKTELANAKSLIGIVRDILPVTEVTMVVNDASGNEAYRHTDTLQNDVIALYTSVQSMDVLEDILDIKKAKLEDQNYLGSVMLYTSVLADLSYIERKVNAALQTVDQQPLDAEEQLLLAQLYGVDMTVSAVENPLQEARRALEMAEQQVTENNYEPAKKSLSKAKNKLEEYRERLGKARHETVKEITSEIETVMKDVKKGGVSGAIRESWHKTVNLFEHKHPRAAKPTESGKSKK